MHPRNQMFTTKHTKSDYSLTLAHNIKFKEEKSEYHHKKNKLKHVRLLIGRAPCNVLGHSPHNKNHKSNNQSLNVMSLYNLGFLNKEAKRKSLC